MRRLAAIVLTGTASLWIISLAGFDPGDWPSHAVSPHNDPTANWCGPVGAFLAYHTYATFGHGIWLAVILLIALLIAHLRGTPVSHPIIRVVGAVFMVVAVSGFQALWFPASGPFPEGGGGLLAIAGVKAILARFNPLGTAIILFMMLLIGSVVAVDWVVAALSTWSWRALGAARKVPVRSVISIAARALPSAASAAVARVSTVAAGGNGRNEVPVRMHQQRRAASLDDLPHSAVAVLDESDASDSSATTADSDGAADQSDSAESADATRRENAASARSADRVARASGADDPEPPQTSVKSGAIDMEALREKIRRLPINFSSKRDPSAAVAQGGTCVPSVAQRAATPNPDEPPVREDYTGYLFPSMDLLAEPEATYSEKLEAYVREQAEALEHALTTYGIDGEVVGIDSGPVITLYEVQLAPGTKVAAITSISSDLARALRAPNIRIVPNMAGKTTVGVEVPNLQKEKVRIKELMTAASDSAARMMLPMFLGKDASGTPLIADLASMPHMLIAGTTGSGKSVCMNTIIMSFLYTKRPDELKLILVDPKMVEMSLFKDIPHLMCPVVTENSRAAAILEWAVTKMEERYEILAEVGVRDVAAYNRLGWAEIRDRLGPMSEAEEAKVPRKLPYIVFVVDELADLILTMKEVETFIVRLAQKARAVGIHLILATQRPQANVVTGLIKSNMPCRISFKVSSGMDSRIVLDQKGAELLLGQGDMLFLGPRSSELIRAQGTLVDDLESRKVVRFLKTVATPSFERQLIALRSPVSIPAHIDGDLAADDPDGESFDGDQRDPLFLDAVEIIIESGRGSVSLLQRRLAIGYTRASRLIDQMGIAGIIGAHKGSVAREVLISTDEWAEMRRMIEAEEAQVAAEQSAAASASPATTSVTPAAAGSSSSGTGVSPVIDNDADSDDLDLDDDDDDDAEDEDDDDVNGNV